MEEAGFRQQTGRRKLTTSKREIDAEHLTKTRD